MTILAWLAVLDAILHATLIGRFGVKQNEPFLVFAVVYAALAIALFLAVPYVLWATLILSVIGLVGFTLTFNKVPRDKTLERVIWGVDALTVLGSVWLLFF